MRNTLLLLGALVLAGCAEPGDPEPMQSGALVVSSIGTGAYEPSLGLGEGGVAFVNAFTPEGSPGVWRSTGPGEPWFEVLDAEARSPTTADPWLWVDRATGRVFSAELIVGGCSWLVWSDDAGETWERNVAGGCGLPAHHFQKLTGGPPPAGVTTQGYPSVLYYSSTSLRDPDPAQPAELIVGGTGTDVSVSLDGGRTFSTPVRVHPPTPGGYSQGGPVAVGPDGTAWSPAQTDAGVRIARTNDAGRSWELVALLDDVGYLDHGSDPSLAVDARGVLHLLYPSREAMPILRSSMDGGVTWSSPRSIAPPNVTSTVFPVLRVLDEGALVAAYLGTNADATAWGADPSFAPPAAAWHLYLTIIEDPAGEPVVTTIRADDDPVQRGCIWMRGGASDCRNHGDFLGLDARDGVVAVAFVDGCEGCPDGVQSTGTGARVAWWAPPRG